MRRDRRPGHDIAHGIVVIVVGNRLRTCHGADRQQDSGRLELV